MEGVVKEMGVERRVEDRIVGNEIGVMVEVRG